ncbi:MAG: beta-ketoacyl-[acyl-carrier-protein] synthase family protein [Desulfobacteraceae bacterium]
MKKNNQVCVTGAGCLSALGNSLDLSMANMFAGTQNVRVPQRFSTTHDIKYPVFEITEPFKPPKSPENSDLTLTAAMGIAAAWQAMDDAGCTPKYFRGKRVGICMGTTVGASLNNETFYREYRQGKNPGMEPIRRFLNSNPAAALAREFDVDGPVQTIVNACASGTDAIGTGALWIRSGLCDIVLAGGTDELCRVTYNGFASLMITDHEPCRPFDARRNGLNLGEGAGVVLLENQQTTDNPVLCHVAGYGAACDGYHLTSPRPDGLGLKKAMAAALKSAGTAPEEIGFINAHGTGTRDNDRVEIRVIQEMMPQTPFFSTKGYTGHTLGAAGALEAVFSIASLAMEKIPKSLGFTARDKDAAVSPVQEETKLSCRAAISQSVAFGGNNSVLIFGNHG